ncbi:MAG TPA: hypothetical protein VK851_03350 [Anaerolineales bacterium]|nr:hypothetical protein [Anaerolineales bacterium]
MNKLNDTLLLQFANTFYGYGNYQAPYWFLGMEEGGGNSIDEINRRFSTWEMRGAMELEDVAEYHIALGFPEFFSSKSKIQNTWGKQIRFIFGVNNKPVDTEIVRDYQRDAWGRKSSNNCIIELFPLPSPGTGDWIYGEASNLDILKDRKTYRNSFFPTRIKHIQHTIEEFQPKVICAFSFTYMNYWEVLTGGKFYENEKENYFSNSIGNTKIVVLQHPAARGVRSEYFYNVGRSVANNYL